MAIFGGWYVYFIGNNAGANPNNLTLNATVEVPAGTANGPQSITNVDNSLTSGDIFTISQVAAVDNAQNGQDYNGGTNVSITFYGSNSDDTIFIGRSGSAWFVFSRSPLTTTGNTSVPSFYNISTANSVNPLLCFMVGTMLRTAHGAAAVEQLRVGDRLVTADGDLTTVRWVGRRSVDPLFTPAERGNPVRIAAGSLGQNVPVRDLYVSPDHGLLIDGLLVNARALINGSTITQVARMAETFTYCHVEVEGHDILMAEGAPAESFVDYVGRRRFDNWAEYEAMYPEAQPITELPYPRVSAARVLPKAVRERLAGRAATLAGATAKAA